MFTNFNIVTSKNKQNKKKYWKLYLRYTGKYIKAKFLISRQFCLFLVLIRTTDHHPECLKWPKTAVSTNTGRFRVQLSVVRNAEGVRFAARTSVLYTN